MEIIIENPEHGISNYQPLIAWAKERTSTYNGLVVQEDGILAAKADVADLRRLAKAASDYRIRIKKEHEAKIADTINQLKELTDIFTATAESIAVQVRTFEDKEKADKRREIENFFDSQIGELNGLITIDRIWDDKWLNKGSQMDAIQTTIKERIAKASEDIQTIRDMKVRYESEMINEYVQTLDIGKALQRRKLLEEREAQLEEMRRRQEEAKAKMAERQEQIQAQMQEAQKAREPIQQAPTIPAPAVQQTSEDEIFTIDLRIYVTQAQKKMFRDFLMSSGIKYSSIPKNN